MAMAPREKRPVRGTGGGRRASRRHTRFASPLSDAAVRCLRSPDRRRQHDGRHHRAQARGRSPGAAQRRAIRALPSSAATCCAARRGMSMLRPWMRSSEPCIVSAPRSCCSVRPASCASLPGAGLSDGIGGRSRATHPGRARRKTRSRSSIEDVGSADIPDSLKATVKAEGIGALAFIPPAGQWRADRQIHDLLR